jgi:esterase/lipase
VQGGTQLKRKKVSYMLIAAALSSFIVTGCSSAVSKNKGHQQVSPSHTDGTIASTKLVSYPGQSPQLNIYKMFYWSQGKKLEMYALVPKNTDTNWLIVNCHGGYDFPGGSPRLSPYTLAGIASDHYTKAMTIFPEYSGYGGSQGSVEGLSSNAIDVENAITAVESLKNVDIQYISDDGVSMGGAVALMVASSPQYSNEISHVILTSPFPGWEVSEKWDEENKTSTVPGAEHQREVTADAATIYGQFSTNSKVYMKNSPVLNDIKVPVLLVQGTDDQQVPWQMTEMLYRDLKNKGVDVTLDLVPGGNHGLTGKYSSTLNNDVDKWLQQQ